jgi:hypothetical protein
MKEEGIPLGRVYVRVTSYFLQVLYQILFAPNSNAKNAKI